MKTKVTFTITADLDDVDFTDCGDGCGMVYGLHCATYKGAQIMCFSSDDVEAATEAMEDELGEKTRVITAVYARAIENDRVARAEELAELQQTIRNELMGDPISMNRRNW